MLHVEVSDSEIREWQNRYDLFGWVARKTPPFFKMNMTAHLRIANLYHNKSQEFWINVLCTEDTKGEIFGCSANHVWPEENSLSAPLPPVRHGNGRMIIWTCSKGPGHLAVTEMIMTSAVYQNFEKCESICLTAEGWLKINHLSGR